MFTRINVDILYIINILNADDLINNSLSMNNFTKKKQKTKTKKIKRNTWVKVYFTKQANNGILSNCIV